MPGRSSRLSTLDDTEIRRACDDMRRRLLPERYSDADFWSRRIEEVASRPDDFLFIMDMMFDLAERDRRFAADRVKSCRSGAPLEMVNTVVLSDLKHLCTSIAVESAKGSVGSSRVDLQACKLEYSIVSPK